MDTTRQKLRSEWCDNDDVNRVHNHFILFPPSDGRSPSMGFSKKADHSYLFEYDADYLKDHHDIRIMVSS